MKATELLSETMVLMGEGYETFPWPLFRKGHPIRPRSTVGYSKIYIMKPAVLTDVEFCLS